MKKISMQLGFGFSHRLLLEKSGLVEIDQAFFDYLKDTDVVWYEKMLSFRRNPHAFSSGDYNELMLAVSPTLEAFLLQLFAIHDEYQRDLKSTCAEAVVSFRALFVQTKIQVDADGAVACLSFDALTAWLCQSLACTQATLSQDAIVSFGLKVYRQQDRIAIEYLQRWCALAKESSSFINDMSSWYILWAPQRVQDSVLDIAIDPVSHEVRSNYSAEIHRDDFNLIESRWEAEKTQIHVDYCKYCHDREVDYCRTGFYKKKGDTTQGFRTNVRGQELAGCPLDQKISQMHWFMHRHLPLSAFIVIMIDNPFCAITGHRICNDCMQSCIYQKQDPVDTPQVESRIVTDVLNLPWGVEIYDLLMKWHPLRKRESIPEAHNHHHVLVMGLGPAGFSMLHHLWMQGCSVTGMDGAHLEPWPYGDVMQPVKYYSALQRPLKTRDKLGFGGVCEYGITSRWDKNLLSVIYLSLLRRQRCHLIGNSRFGGTITVEDAWQLGFSHMVLALGAGLPRALNIKNSLAKGMQQASDFLMSLHTLGAQSDDNQTSLTLEMPCVVIGAGLTAVDTATEAQTYYLHLVQLVYLRLSKLITSRGEKAVQACFSELEYERLKRWSMHGHAVQQEKRVAAQTGRSACFRLLLEQWGGVRMVYRRAIEFAPAYRNNHDELQAALDAGVILQTHTDVCSVEVDANGFVSRLRCLQPWQLMERWCAPRLKDVLFSDDYCRCVIDSSDQLFVPGMIIRFIDSEQTGKELSAYWEVAVVASASIDLKLWTGNQVELRSYQGSFAQLIVAAPKRDCSLAARSILVATGSQPNTAFEYEHRGHFERDGEFYRLHGLDQDGLTQISSEQSSESAFFTSYCNNLKRVSVIGDLHPHFHGSVVKALASSQAATNVVMRHLQALGAQASSRPFPLDIAAMFEVRLLKNRNLFEDYYLLTIKAPWFVQKFQPGMMFKLQAYIFSSSAAKKSSKSEAVQCQPFDYDIDAQTLSFVLRSDQASHRDICRIPEGSMVSLMGPTGVGLSKKVANQKVMVIADETRLLSACLYRKHYALHAQRVDFYVEYSIVSQRLLTILEQNYPVCWLMPEDRGDFFVHEMSRYEMIVIHGHFNFVKKCYQDYCRLIPKNAQSGKVIGYVGGPMQCMLKGICAQCLQWQIDPETGQRTKAVFACSWQDQPLELVDLSHCQQRHDGCQAFRVLNENWIFSHGV